MTVVWVELLFLKATVYDDMHNLSLLLVLQSQM